MDQYRCGYITVGAFARWFQLACGFEMSDADLSIAQNYLSRRGDQRLWKEDFVRAFAADPIEEEEAPVEQQAEEETKE